MDSKVVNTLIKKEIFSFLKEKGFTIFTTRSAWRYKENKIEVVNFQSFNSYLASGVGCTTYSFAVNLGIFFTDIYSHHQFKERNGCLCPEEYECHFRLQLQKKIKQRKLPRKDVWYIDPKGKYLENVIVDSKYALANNGLSWFDKFDDKHEVLSVLTGDVVPEDGTWGFGNNPSPNRSYQTGYIALSLNEFKIAEIALKKAIDSGFYNHEQVLEDYMVAKQKLNSQ